LASAVQKIIKIAEQLLLVPFFISAWGAAYYGEWLTLTIIPTVIGLSELGFGTAAANSFVLKYASGEKQSAANVAKSGFRIILLMVVSFILLSLISLYVLNYFHVFDKSLIDKNQSIIAVACLMIARLMGFFMPLNEAHFRAARKASLGMNLMSVYAAFNVIIGLVVLLCKGSIVMYAFTNLMNAVVFTILYAVIAQKILPISKEYRGIILRDDVNAIVKKGFGYFLSPVWQAVFFQGTTFVVRVALGPVAVTVFNTVRTLTRAVTQANSMVIYTVLPELQYEMGAGNLPQARKIFRFGLIVISIIAISGVVFMYIGGPWFYELWTRKALNPPNMMWNIFIISIMFNGLWWMGSDVLIAANKPYDFTIVSTIVAVISVCISYFLAKSYELTGAAMGSFFLDLMLFVYVLPKSCKLINQPIETLISESISDFKSLSDSWIKGIRSNK